MDLRAAWDVLAAPWQICIDEAWTSWRGGSAGVGCVIATDRLQRVAGDGGDVVTAMAAVWNDIVELAGG